MAKVGVGLDIGTGGVKAVRVSGTKSLQVNRFAAVTYDEGVLAGGAVVDRETVSAAVKKVLRVAKIGQKKVVAAIAGQAVVVRHIKMPLMDEGELAGAVRWEAERYIPFPVEEVVLDYEITSRNRDAGEMEILLVCAHNDIIHSHLDVLREAGLQPLAVDIQPFAMMRGMGIEHRRPEGNVAMLDIGAGSSDLVIAGDGIPSFTRILPVAGNRLTELVAKHTKLEKVEAEEAKIAHNDLLIEPDQSAGENREDQVNMALKEGLKDLALELRRSFDYYQLQHKGEVISELILSGGGSMIKNLPSFLEKELEVKVSRGVFDERLRCPQSLLEEFKEYLPVFTVALGLALREVTGE